MLEEERLYVDDNTLFSSAFSAALDWPGLLDATGRAVAPPFQVQAGHLGCVLVLLKAGRSLSEDQFGRLLELLKEPRLSGLGTTGVPVSEVRVHVLVGERAAAGCRSRGCMQSWR